MKRFHVHIAVNDLEGSIRFYSTVFGFQPTVLKPDYAKWMIDDPRVNFAISTRSPRPGLDHLGIQADSEEELHELRGRLEGAELPIASQEDAACCYARSNKYWTVDPQGIAWETFHSLSTIPVFGEDAGPSESAAKAAEACCAPTREAIKVAIPRRSSLR
jgi:catechol 2,3-dioxygenase-like lactoylglutathione lyase family enzyme